MLILLRYATKDSVDIQSLRNRVAHEIETNRDIYEPFIQKTNIDDITAFQKYVDGIKRAEWADEIEMMAVEKLYNRPIFVYDSNGSKCRTFPSEETCKNSYYNFETNEYNQPIILIYKGSNPKNHYNNLRILFN